MEDYEFGVVIVGGGSAGCGAAGRLCATTDLRVCLVEAGPDYGPVREGYWPNELLDSRVQPATHDWGFGEKGDYGSRAPEPRAKVIGGCSSHNQRPLLVGMSAGLEPLAAAGEYRRA